MRSFFAVVLIFLAMLAYGSAFVTDTNSRQRELERLEALAITPPPGGGVLTLEPDPKHDAPQLSPRPPPVLQVQPYRAIPAPAPSPEPSRNEFRIDDQTRQMPGEPSGSLLALLLGLIVTPAHAQTQPVQLPDASRKALEERREDEIELQFTTGDGRAWAAYVRRDDASVFLQSTLRYIDERRERTKEKLRGDIEAVFDDAFADREEAIEEFADWYYGFFTSGLLAGKGVWGGVREIPSFDLEMMQSGVELAVQEGIRYEFLTRVMKPELRDPVIQDGVREAIMDAHRDYLWMIEGLDARLITFISDHARYVRPMDPRERVHLTLDWDSESWRAPLHYDRQAVLFGAGGVLTVTGAVLAADIVAETALMLLGSIIGEAVIAAETGAAGAAVGTETLAGPWHRGWRGAGFGHAWRNQPVSRARWPRAVYCRYERCP
jgi:hypothetical protein